LVALALKALLRAACDYNDEDQKAFILSVNNATWAPRSGRRRLWGKKGKASLSDGFSATRLKQARLVFKSAPDLAKAVLEGTKPLNDAYDEVRVLADMSHSQIQTGHFSRRI
jgi:hypothetical protein